MILQVLDTLLSAAARLNKPTLCLMTALVV